VTSGARDTKIIIIQSILEQPRGMEWIGSNRAIRDDTWGIRRSVFPGFDVLGRA
jgi:hypothetical protein